MIINPNTAINEGWLKFPNWMSEEQKQKCIQPNAIDVTCDRVFQVLDFSEPFSLSESEKRMLPQQEQTPSDGWFRVPAHGFVDVMSDFFITVPNGMVATFIVRSTLNRNGLYITNGLYDQGFSNYCGLILHNRSNSEALIKKNTRIGQVMFIAAEDSGLLYNGIYNQNTNEHWTTHSQ